MVFDRDESGTSALHEAARAGWNELVDMLLKAGAPQSPMNKEEKIPVYHAAQNSNTKIKLLISKNESEDKSLPEWSGPSNLPSGPIELSPMLQRPDLASNSPWQVTTRLESPRQVPNAEA